MDDVSVDDVGTTGARTVVVGHRDQVIRFGLRSVLAGDRRVGRIECVAEPAELDRRLRAGGPDVVIVSAAMLDELACGVSGRDGGRPKFLVLLRPSDPPASRALESDLVDGLLYEGEVDEGTLSNALRALDCGSFPAPPEVIRELVGGAGAGAARSQDAPARLSPREHEALVLMSEGLSNKQIARRLRISEHGAKRHVANVLAKLNCQNRTSATMRALLEGLVAPPATPQATIR